VGHLEPAASILEVAMVSSGRLRAWLATITAVLGSALSVLTFFIPDWIETLFEAKPDGGSGEAEWLISGILLAISVVCIAWAAFEWRALRHSSARP